MSETKAITVRENGSGEHDKTKAIWIGAGNAALTADQARALAYVGEQFDLSPALGEIVLMGTKVYVTMEGYARIAERHPQYDGYELWPLTDDERKAMRVGANESAWGCKVHRKDRKYPAVGYGVASDASISMTTIRVFVDEQAQKRAMHRAMRMAFRAGVPRGIDEGGEAVGAGTALLPAPGNEPPLYAVDAPMPALPQPDWPKFWLAVKGLGVTGEQAHEILGFPSVADYPGTLEQAYEEIERWVAARDLLTGPDAVPGPKAPSAPSIPAEPAPDAEDAPIPPLRFWGDLYNVCRAEFRLSREGVLKELGYKQQPAESIDYRAAYLQIRETQSGRLA